MPEDLTQDPEADLIARWVGRTAGADTTRLAGGVARLSRHFTRERVDFGSDYLEDPALRRSYTAYFGPVTLGKVRAVLGELPPDGARDAEDEGVLRILDLGCGPGTAALGALGWLRRIRGAEPLRVELVLVDQSKPALRAARDLLRAYLHSAPSPAPDVTVTPVCASLARTSWPRALPKGTAGRYGLILSANCLNELFRGSREADHRRARVVEQGLDLLHPRGTLAIIEPASRPESRALHRLRDLVLARRACTVYSPCLHDRPCPALVHEEDWCHEERPWAAPPIVRAIDAHVGFIKDAVKFSYLVLRLDGRTIVPRHPETFRVVSERRVFKGEMRAWLCNETGRAEVGRLDRARSAANEAVDGWHRGAIVRVADIVRRSAGAGARSVGRIPEEGLTEIVRTVEG